MLIKNIFATLKKKISPQNGAEIHKIIKYICTEIEKFLYEYSRFLSNNKVFCIRCKLCGEYFIAGSLNARLQHTEEELRMIRNNRREIRILGFDTDPGRKTAHRHKSLYRVMKSLQG